MYTKKFIVFVVLAIMTLGLIMSGIRYSTTDTLLSDTYDNLKSGFGPITLVIDEKNSIDIPFITSKSFSVNKKNKTGSSVYKGAGLVITFDYRQAGTTSSLSGQKPTKQTIVIENTTNTKKTFTLKLQHMLYTDSVMWDGKELTFGKNIASDAATFYKQGTYTVKAYKGTETLYPESPEFNEVFKKFSKKERAALPNITAPALLGTDISFRPRGTKHTAVFNFSDLSRFDHDIRVEQLCKGGFLGLTGRNCNVLMTFSLKNISIDKRSKKTFDPWFAVRE